MYADDMNLLREFAANGSEAAFTTLVQRYVNLVYSAALRQLGNTHEAEEVAQAVFILLARKAGRLRRGTVLSGWLYRTAQLTAANFRRAAIRRQRREQEAFMQFSEQSQPDADWHRLAPLLEDAMSRLGQKERDAVVIRFFENCTVREVAAALGLREDAAQKRVNRGTEKLREYFISRGIQVSTADLLASIGTHSVQAAPAGMAKTISAVAIAKGAAAGGSTLTFIKGALKIMAWSKAKTAAVAGVCVLLATAATTVVVIRNEARRDTWRVWPGDFSAFDATLKNTPPQVRILPTKFPNRGSYGGGTGGKLMGFGESIEGMAQIAFASPSEHNWDNSRTIVSPDVPKGRYDFIANLSEDSWLALQKEMEKKLGVVGKREMRNTDVLLLTVKRPNDPGLKPGTAADGRRGSKTSSDGETSFVNFAMPDLAISLQRALNVPVVDGTGLTGNFTFHIKLDRNDPDGIKQSLLDHLGLELVSTNMPVEMLVIEKAN